MSVTSKAPNSEKGKRYFTSLDEALCNGYWRAVPEFARKTEKHAPERRCFTLTARTEAQIASASHRPTSATSADTTSIHSLSEAVPKLREAIAAKETVPEDAYCASACIAEIYWLQEDVRAALEALPNAITGSEGRQNVPLGWLEVCAAKNAFIQAAAMKASGKETEAQEVYRAAANQTPGTRTPELRRWTERLLAQGCMYNYKRAQQPSLQSLNESLLSFRAWANFWQRAPTPASGNGVTPSRIDIPRRQVWKAYYELLSVILRHDVLYAPSALQASEPLFVSGHELSNAQYTDAKLRQRAELKRVESTYESLLLSETQFPKASQSNPEVEEFVEQAVGNWKNLCGSDWADDELGEGGKAAVGKGMLEMLYRAATKTFHSTAVLRQLFTVHAALGEFDLAMHAFKSYSEIVSRGKARAEKTGEHDVGLDSEDTAILTAADAVRVLCRYGDREHAKKAFEVGSDTEQWLGQQRPHSATEVTTSDDNKIGEAEPPSRPTEKVIMPTTKSAAYRTIGIGQAQWARLTYETEIRPKLQADAITNLQRARSYDEQDVETAYALAHLLAETQDVSSAIEVIRQAIAASRTSEAQKGIAEADDVAKQRQLVPLWHLLALCLTAKEEYEAAVKMCNAAFEQFDDSSVLFGDSEGSSSSEPHKRRRSQRGVVDQMDLFEREALLQIKISQLTLVELMEGPEKAVDLSDELLRLYSRLFGNPDQLKAASKSANTALTVASPSRAGGGTLRSIAGSIRPKSGRTSAEVAQRQVSDASALPASTNGQGNGAPIAITVTNENGVSAEKDQHRHGRHLHLPFKIRGHNGDVRETGSLRSKKSTEDLNEKTGSQDSGGKPPAVPAKDVHVTDHAHSAANPPPINNAIESTMSLESPASPQQPIKQIEHNAPHNALPAPVGHDGQPLEQDVRLPAPHPASNMMPLPSVDPLHERQHKISVLVKVWLYIADLYARADFHDDAAGAIDEAYQLVGAFEAYKAAQNANARALFFKGWGGGKSVDELWADVHAAKGTLASAQTLPFAAMAHYEEALNHYPDHPAAIIGISDLLMDIYEEKIPAEEPQPLLAPLPTISGSLITDPVMLPGAGSRPTTAKSTLANTGRVPPPNARNKDPTPAELNRLAARDRAYMLLSNLTKLGSGWDNAEAWYTLARAHELSKQVQKAKQALWWVVELEDNKPMRHWSEVAPGGYSL